MGANHRETKAQGWDKKYSSKPTKHTRRKTLSKPGVANMAKLRATRDATSKKKCNKMREQIEKRRLHKISKLWSHLRLMKRT